MTDVGVKRLSSHSIARPLLAVRVRQAEHIRASRSDRVTERTRMPELLPHARLQAILEEHNEYIINGTNVEITSYDTEPCGEDDRRV